MKSAVLKNIAHEWVGQATDGARASISTSATLYPSTLLPWGHIGHCHRSEQSSFGKCRSGITIGLHKM